MKTSKGREANVNSRKAIKNVSSARESTKTEISIPDITVGDQIRGVFLSIRKLRGSPKGRFELLAYPLSGDIPLTSRELYAYLYEAMLISPVSSWEDDIGDVTVKGFNEVTIRYYNRPRLKEAL